MKNNLYFQHTIMENTKPFYESKTYLGLATLIWLLLYKGFGIEITELELWNIIESVAITMSLIMVVIWRNSANTKITFLPKAKWVDKSKK